MPDFGAPVAQGLDVNPLRSISQIIGLQSAQLGVQQQKQALQGQQAEVQQVQQTARQRSAIANIDWDKYHADDGTIDVGKLVNDKDAQRGAGDAFPALVQQALQIKGHQIENIKGLVGLGNERVAALGKTLGPLATDPEVVNDTDQGRRLVASQIANYGKLYGPEAAQAVAPFAAIVQHAPPGKLASAINGAQMQANDALQQLQTQAPNYGFVNSGADQLRTQSNPYASGGAQVPSDIVNKVAPGAIVVPDLSGAPNLVNPQNPGNPRRIGGNGFQSPTYPGQVADIAANQNEVRGVRQQADQAPLNRNINQNILRLSGDARTGPGTEVWQHVLGAIGAPLGLSPTASYQEVGKYLEKNAIANMQAMGSPGSDARLSAAAAANGSTSFNKQALQDVTKFNDATNSALIKYRQGIDQAVGTRNANYTDLPRFKSEWAKNFDVNIFRVENAIRDGDKEELGKIKKELGPARMHELAVKRKNLESLSETGELPRG